MTTRPYARRSFLRGPALDVAVLLVAGALSAWYCLATGRALSATFDEPVYLREGLELWRTGKVGELMSLGTMPLPLQLQTLPLFLVETLRSQPLDPLREIAWTLPVARSVTLLFWWLLLFYAWRAGRQLAGPWAGRLAVALLACEPVFLAHASLATSDLAVTAILLALFVEYRTLRDASWWPRVAIPAGLYGLALLAKASALVFGVIGMFAIQLAQWTRRGLLRWPLSWARLRGFAIETACIVALGLSGAILYVGSDWEQEPSFVEWAETLPPGALREAMTWTADNLRIFSNAGEGLVQQIKHNIRGHGAYLLGEEYRRAVWFYFPVVLSIKTSLPLLLLPLFVAAFRPRALGNWAMLAAFLLLLFSLNSRVQIGVRFMLPLLACLAVGLAAALVLTAKSSGQGLRFLLGAVLALALTSNVYAALRVWPHALAYINPLWGGTLAGYRLVSDSNYDWGQGLQELRAWANRHAVEPVDLWYFGADPRADQAPFQRVFYHVEDWRAGRSLDEITRGKVVAVSATHLYGAYVGKVAAGRESLAFFRSQSPAGRTTTFFIYDFRNRQRQSPQESSAPPTMNQ